jgi:hypothetical protein
VSQAPLCWRPLHANAPLILPTGRLSGVECPVTSKYVAWLPCRDTCDPGSRVRRTTSWNGPSASFQTLTCFSPAHVAILL